MDNIKIETSAIRKFRPSIAVYELNSIVIEMGITSKHAAFEIIKLFVIFERGIYSNIEYINAGQNAIFRCSQVLSFTAEISANGLYSFEQSYRKCNMDPVIEIKITPNNSHKNTLYVIVTPPFNLNNINIYSFRKVCILLN